MHKHQLEHFLLSEAMSILENPNPEHGLTVAQTQSMSHKAKLAKIP